MLQQVWERLPDDLKASIRRRRYKRQIKIGQFRSPEMEFEVLGNYIRPGDWVLDIGANIGHYTLEFARLVGDTGRVLAFEPLAETFSFLTSNVQAAGYRNITLFNTAVSDRCWLAGLEVPNGNTYQAHIADNSANKVLCISPVAFGGGNRLSFIKIDAEGHEPQIVEALSSVIRVDKPVLMVECNGEFLKGWAKRHGYRFAGLKGSHNHILEPA